MEIIISILVLLLFLLAYLLFPMLCAIIMKLLCKNFSDQFIVKFLSIACPIPVIIRSILYDIYKDDDPLGFTIASIIFSTLLAIYLCNLLAKVGVNIMNKRNPNHRLHSIAGSARSE